MRKLGLVPVTLYVEPLDVHLKPLCGAFLRGPLKLYLEPFDLYVKPVSGTFIWNLHLKPLILHVEPPSPEQLSVEPSSRTLI